MESTPGCHPPSSQQPAPPKIGGRFSGLGSGLLVAAVNGFSAQMDWRVGFTVLSNSFAGLVKAVQFSTKKGETLGNHVQATLILQLEICTRETNIFR